MVGILAGSYSIVIAEIIGRSYTLGEDRKETEIGTVLDRLVGERLWAFGRAHTLWWLHFGERREVPVRRRGEVVGAKEVGTYALHLQCPWMVADRGGVLVGQDDLFLAPGDDPYAQYGSFDWAPQGANRADALLAELLSGWGPGGPWSSRSR